MTNHPRRRRTRSADVVAWVEKWVDATLTADQADTLRRMVDDGHRDVVLATDGTGDDAVTVAAVPMDDGKLWLAPVGTPPPIQNGTWLNAGHTFDPVDLRPIMSDVDDDVRAIAATTLQHRVVSVTTGIVGPGFHIGAPVRGFEDNVTGKVWHDGLHPDSSLEWMVTTEGRTADGDPLRVCDHCGEPTPCTEKVLRHMDTDMHHAYCTVTGYCVIAERRTTELPAR